MILRDTNGILNMESPKRVKVGHWLSEFCFQVCTSVVVESPSIQRRFQLCSSSSRIRGGK